MSYETTDQLAGALTDPNGRAIPLAEDGTLVLIAQSLAIIQQNLQDLAEVLDAEITQLQAKINPVVVPAPVVTVTPSVSIPAMLAVTSASPAALTASKLEESNSLLRSILLVLCNIQDIRFEDAVVFGQAQGSILSLPA